MAGELGSGKTLTLTFLIWKNWFYRKKKVYSNYHLFKIPYIYINSTTALDKMGDGFFGADEFWLWVDALETKVKKNRVTTNILLKSRKRGLTYCYSSQTLEQLNRRVRKVQDFTSYPILNPAESICKVVVFRTGFPNAGTYMKTFYFKTNLIFTLYDTNEEIQPLQDGEGMAIDERIIFQPEHEKDHDYLCGCEKCGTKLFEKWEDADKYAEEYWRQRIKLLKELS
jgi:hypothetical protein